MFAELLSQGGLSLDRLRSFCEVAQAGGVTRAAKGDPARQSLFSRQIKELEEFFGTELIRRKGRGIALTAAGEQLNMLAREQLSALSDFKKAGLGKPVELALAAGESLIQWLLLPQMEAIRERLPNVVFRVLNLPTAEIARQLRDGSVDVGLVPQGRAGRPLQSSPLGVVTYSLFVPQRLAGGAGSRPLSARTVAGLPLATLEGAGQFRVGLGDLFARQKLALNIQLEVSSFPLAARAVQTGLYGAILPSMAGAELARAGVVEIKLEFLRPLSRRVELAWNPRTARIRGALGKALPVLRSLCAMK